MSADVLRRLEGGQVIFFCPGCKCGHVVWVNGTTAPSGSTWGWNQRLDKPTFTPSILTNHIEGSPGPRCHSFVTDGRIQFLGDCDHELRGQTVDLPPFPGWDAAVPG